MTQVFPSRQKIYILKPTYLASSSRSLSSRSASPHLGSSSSSVLVCLMALILARPSLKKKKKSFPHPLYVDFNFIFFFAIPPHCHQYFLLYVVVIPVSFFISFIITFSPIRKLPRFVNFSIKEDFLAFSFPFTFLLRLIHS